MEGICLIHLQGVAGVQIGTDIHLQGKVPQGGIRHPEGTLTHLKGIERDTVHQVMVDIVKIIATIIEVIGLQTIGMALDISLRGLRRGLVVPLGNGPRSAVGNVSGYRCMSDCRSKGCKFDPGPVPYFRGD